MNSLLRQMPLISGVKQQLSTLSLNDVDRLSPSFFRGLYLVPSLPNRTGSDSFKAEIASV